MKVKAKGHRDLVTLVGSQPSVSAGECVTVEGHWVQDREFGLQFRADVLNSTAPTTKKGIGPVYAKGSLGQAIYVKEQHSSLRLVLASILLRDMFVRNWVMDQGWQAVPP